MTAKKCECGRKATKDGLCDRCWPLRPENDHPDEARCESEHVGLRCSLRRDHAGLHIAPASPDDEARVAWHDETEHA